MPDEPRTVRDVLLQHHAEIELRDDHVDGDLHALKPFLDALIGCNGKVVFTAEDVERAANSVPAQHTIDCSCGRKHHHFWSFDERKAIARAAITAASGVVCDEAMVQVVDAIDGDDGSVRWLDSTDPDEEWSFTKLRPGDKLYIVRVKED